MTDAPAAADAPLLEVTGLQTVFRTAGGGEVTAVDGVSLRVDAGDTLAIVGESGSGKSVTALSIMRLLPARAGRIARGSIRLRGRELTTLSDDDMRAVRGRHIGMIFQEPMTSLNPVHTVGAQIAEVVRCHEGLSRDAANRHAVDMLALVGIPEPARRAGSYPHQLSGGMRQRVMIAMALACRPSVLIADEPTTALDVTIQAQILDLMEDLQARLGMAIVFITHDLGVVAQIADRVMVMYAAQVVEAAPVGDLYATPRMPYTAGLLGSIPRLGRARDGQRLHAIPGQVPALTQLPAGCRFSTRCAYVEPRCTTTPPPLDTAATGHDVRCLRWSELALGRGAGA
jgi:peptide/nickel transport system ATP-binding protein/oligopeptide transport system ATP-binding protein